MSRGFAPQRLAHLDRAQIRVGTGIKTPDALQVAAALSVESTGLVTNDDRWPERVGGLRILQLESYLG